MKDVSLDPTALVAEELTKLPDHQKQVRHSDGEGVHLHGGSSRKAQNADDNFSIYNVGQDVLSLQQ